jgi:exonuclease VII small subunit|tara:strand:+ start:227 stop:673 length:447 start_codon:yes stop_codon:yes gene_type:complete
MKKLSIVILAISTSFGLANQELNKKLDELFDLRIKIAKVQNKEFLKDAESLGNPKVRELLVKSESDLGQHWIKYLGYMKVTPDLKARLLVLRLEIVNELNNGYYNLEDANSFLEKTQANASIVKWKKALKELEEAEAIYKNLAKEKQK